MSDYFDDEIYPINPDLLIAEAQDAAQKREKQTAELQAHGRAYDDYDLRYEAYEGEDPLAPTIADLAYYRASYEELHPYEWTNPYEIGENNGKQLPAPTKAIFDELMAECTNHAEALDWLRFTAYELSRLEDARAYTLAFKTQETISLYLSS